MPKRTDLSKILILGAGPIVIGQACEFDYSGAQACYALKEEGYHVILVNSNPATIMTDPAMSDVTYIEPLNAETLTRIIEKERPCALLPTMGGQTALNCALDLARKKVLKKYNVELIGANQVAIDKAEDREKFRKAMEKINLAVPHSAIAHSLEEAVQVQASLGFPTIVRPSFTLGGSGGGIAYNMEEFVDICTRGLALSPTHELLVEESLLGWKEFELEVVRDPADNCIIVCSIENFDPMGVHTGDSITVSPIQTLTDKEYQVLRNAAIAIVREIGVDTGGANVQFGVCPKTGRVVVIEMNPRVSRSSALASKATGFPIAKIAAKLAVGYTLNELNNPITGDQISAAFEPVMDYVVTKIPRFSFEKFPSSPNCLTSQMKSVGEVMAIGSHFAESLQKAMRGLEVGSFGFEGRVDLKDRDALEEIEKNLRTPSHLRLWYLGDAFRLGQTVEWVNGCSGIDPWFLHIIKEIIDTESDLQQKKLKDLTPDTLRLLKQQGFSDHRLAELLQTDEEAVRNQRLAWQVKPVYKRIDSCAAEFPVTTAYMYSTYASHCEANPNKGRKIVVLGGGPNRIGQGIEFDYCCVHAAIAAKEAGYETLMINCNPETVSTDYDISDRLYFEPLTLEDVLAIVTLEQPAGVIVQYGGQTPLKLARALEKAGVPIVGTSPDSIDHAEDRERFRQLLQKLGLKQPVNETVMTLDQGLAAAKKIGYPLVVRPSYVLGGQAMEIVYQDSELQEYMTRTVATVHDAPILLDRFLDDAIEVDVDAISDGTDVLIVGIMEHIEQAGVHSGDSACSLPVHSLSPHLVEAIKEQVTAMALTLRVVGLMNVQFAIQGEQIFVLEVNPRASRTVPFVSKATGILVAKIAALCMLGQTLREQGYQKMPQMPHYAVKVSVFPFEKFSGADPILGPEMKSTGEVMGVGQSFTEAYAKAIIGAGTLLKRAGSVFISVRDADKQGAIAVAQGFTDLGFRIVATRGTAAHLKAAGIDCEPINKVREGRPHIVDEIKNKQIDFIINTTQGKKAIADSYTIRQSALSHKVNYTTTIAAAKAVLKVLAVDEFSEVNCLQKLHRSIVT